MLIRYFNGAQCCISIFPRVFMNRDSCISPIRMLSFYTYRNLIITLVRREVAAREGANKRGNSSRLTQSFHFFMFEPIFSPVNASNQPI